MSEVIPSPLNPTGKPPVDAAVLAKKRAEIVEEIQWLERLTQHDDFRRYVEKMKAESDISRRKIDSIETLTAEQSGRYAQKFIAQLDSAEWADRQLDYLRKKVLDEQRKV